MSIMGTMSMAQQALATNQYAIDVVANNISNVNTRGYSKQRVELASLTNYSYNSKNYIGAGVQIDSVLRYREKSIDAFYRDSMADTSFYSEMANQLDNIEKVMNELKGTGMQASFSKFFDAVQALVNDPTNVALRSNYIEQAKAVAQKFNEMSNTLTNSQIALIGDINMPGSIDTSTVATLTAELNSKFDQLTKLNKDIIQTSANGQMPYDLLDQRDLLLDDISQYLPIKVQDNTNGTVSISLNGMSLVDGTEVKGYLKATSGDASSPLIFKLTDKDGKVIIPNINDKVTSGALGGILKITGTDPTELNFSSVLNKLDTLAREFANSVNSIQNYSDGTKGAMAISVDPATGVMTLKPATESIFDTKDGSATINAGNIKINDIFETTEGLWEIAAARVEVDGSGNPVDNRAVGNSDNGVIMGELRNLKLTGLGNSTIDKYLTTTASEIGIKTSAILDSLSIRTKGLEQVDAQRQSAIGVNMDEELIDLVKFQRAYEAAARVFNTASDILSVLINLGR